MDQTLVLAVEFGRRAVSESINCEMACAMAAAFMIMHMMKHCIVGGMDLQDVQLTIIDCARIDDPQLCVFLDCLVVGLSDIFPLRLVPSWTLPTMQDTPPAARPPHFIPLPPTPQHRP